MDICRCVGGVPGVLLDVGLLAVGPIRGFALALGIATIFDLLFTRLYTRNAIPVIVAKLNNTRLMYPIKNKDMTNV